MQTQIHHISINQVLENLEHPDYLFIDIRESSLYNGFKSPKALRGGHLPRAVQFRASWLPLIAEEKFEQFVKGKGITHNKQLVFYGDDTAELSVICQAFAQKSYAVSQFSDYLAYANNPLNPLEKIPNYHWLISPQWLAKLLNNETVECAPAHCYKVFETGYTITNQKSGYFNTHIPDSYFFDTNQIENPPLWNLSERELIEQQLLKSGIDCNTTVILYARDQLSALRVLWALKWAGVKDIRFLDGGLQAWLKSGYALETHINTPQPITQFGVTIPDNPQVNISLPHTAFQQLQQQQLKLISIRSWEEYIGQKSGYEYLKNSGEPQGAIWGFAGSDADHIEDYLNPDNTLRNPFEIFNLWQQQGVQYGERLAFYCGTGWRASIPWFLTQLVGWENTLIYDGGWNAWQKERSLPVQHGAPHNMLKPDAMNDY